ncbi:hypothetical protein CW751_14250 [Brumimicrobium salinarum]|uniref:DUF1573 domain-containing protein n=1 Tax=Brumimicrobium salinarum TaxID=2058658 RepID=A0A2I0QZ32_9FLAO|nr:DUF1573 domain-containing protein [Brumimicrobium salinarum]PKR79577.1 hypothetical protein CW751_14250 [Brumimicrobium salinarum]
MKNVFVLLIIILNSATGFAQFAEFDFISKTTHKWEKTNEGEQLNHYFVFKNIGDVPLIINDAITSCSCTTVKTPQHPVLPNKMDSIGVSFDTNKKYYNQNRTIQLKANTKNDEQLRIKVFVIPKE